MDLLIRFFYSVITAMTTLYVLTRLVPKLKRQPRVKHIIMVLYISIFLTLYESSSIVHVLTYYASLIMLIKLFYGNSSFVASMSILFLFMFTMLSAMFTSNLTLLMFSESVDFRAIYASKSFSANVIFIIMIILLLNYYRLIVRLFKKVAGSNFKFDVFMILSNIVLFALVFAYQKITFVNMVDFASNGIINARVGTGYNSYFLLTYFFVSLTSLVVIVLINRLFIVDKNLERYKFKAETDLMTGALSREAGLTHLKNEMAHAITYKYDLTIAYVDVNDLKIVNDRFGHKEGDKLIKAISDIVQSSLREFDIISRLGGDEFLVIFTRCNKAQAQRIWRRITEEFIKVNAEGEYEFKISASVGITQFNPVKHTTLLSYVHEADEEMYHHKKAIKASLL